jgi:hypothetical protein
MKTIAALTLITIVLSGCGEPPPPKTVILDVTGMH